MRQRLGIRDEAVLRDTPGVSWRKARIQVVEGLGKVKEGMLFFVRGIRLLGSDLGAAVRLFLRAAIGEEIRKKSMRFEWKKGVFGRGLFARAREARK